MVKWLMALSLVKPKLCRSICMWSNESGKSFSHIRKEELLDHGRVRFAADIVAAGSGVPE